MGAICGSGWALRAACVAVAAALIAALALAPTSVEAADPGCPNARIAAKRSNVVQTRDAVLCEINRIREQRGLPALNTQEELRTAAQRHSKDMVERRYFGHDSPGGQGPTERAKRAGYVKPNKSWGLGENLAWATRTRATAEKTVQLWMDSPPHRAVILERRYEDAGVGIGDGVPKGRRRAGATVTLLLGYRD